VVWAKDSRKERLTFFNFQLFVLVVEY